MENASVKPKTMASAFTETVQDVGVQFAAGNLPLFWSAGTGPQIMATAGFLGSATVKFCSELADEPKGLLAVENIGLKITTTSLAAITAYTGMQIPGAEDSIPLLATTASGAFVVANSSIAGWLDGAREKLSSVFNKAMGHITTQAETYATIGLAVAAYMVKDSAAVDIPYLVNDVPQSLLTFLPTLSGGAIATKNALDGADPNRLKPMAWIAGGLALTAGTGFTGGEYAGATANAIFSSAYFKIQAEREGGYRQMARNVSESAKSLVAKIF